MPYLDIVDIKPQNMEELTEVITAARVHPSQCHTMMYSTSRGAIKLVDTRQAALCDKSAKVCYIYSLLDVILYIHLILS